MSAEPTTNVTNYKSTYVSQKLTEFNFLTWENEMKYVFQAEDLCFDGIKNTPEGENPFAVKDDPKTCLILLKSVNETIGASLYFHESASAKWNYLYRTFSGKNIARKYEGIKALATFKFGPGSVASNFERLRTLIMTTSIAAGKKSISLEDLGVAMLLNSAPSRFSPTRAILEAKRSEISIQAAQDALTAEEQRLGLRETPQVAASTATTEGSSSTCPVSKRAPAICWHCHPELSPRNQTCRDCGKKGHLSAKNRNCPRNVSDKRTAAVAFNTNDDTDVPPPTSSFRKRIMAVTKKLGGLKVNTTKSKTTTRAKCYNRVTKKVKPSYFTAAAHQATHPMDTISDFQTVAEQQSFLYFSPGTSPVHLNPTTPQPVVTVTTPEAMDVVLDSGCSQSIISSNKNLLNYSPIKVSFRTADNGILICTGKGDLALTDQIIIKNVLHCPEVALNLISVSQLCDQGFTVKINKLEMTIMRKKQLMLRVYRYDNLYVYLKSQ